ncbi:MAG: ABC transporter ATP-binding protein [Fervidicoccaceae archaeon]
MSPILSTEGLRVYFKGAGLFRSSPSVRAVDGVSINVGEGEVLGIVGESGSGKTTLGKAVIRLIEPTGGKLIFMGMEITHTKEKELRRLRKSMQIVHQDPYSSLNPRMRIIDIVGRPLEVHELVKSEKEKREAVAELLRKVGLSESLLYRYPHELSGGQRQRVSVARAIAPAPKLIVLDEPTSALDVSVQAQLLNLLRNLRREMGVSYLFISHDLSVVYYMSDRIAVMYAGKIVESGSADDVFFNPLHPYTSLLLKSIPQPDPRKKIEILAEGEPPNPASPPPGCRFHPRCPRAMDICSRKEPELVEVERNHFVACHLYGGSA